MNFIHAYLILTSPEPCEGASIILILQTRKPRRENEITYSRFAGHTFGLLIRVCLSPSLTLFQALSFLGQRMRQRQEGVGGWRSRGDRPAGLPHSWTGTEAHCHFAEWTEHPWKLWLVALNLRNVFASPKRSCACRTALQIP